MVAISLELTLLYFCTPLLIVSGFLPLRWTMPLLFSMTLIIGGLVLVRNVKRSQLGMEDAGHRNFTRCARLGLLIWAIAQTLAACLHLALGRAVFPMLEQAPLLFVALVFFYALSVMAQEFLFRAFFFWRYSGLASRPVLLGLNVVAFAWVHYVFGSWISVVLSGIGGIIFGTLFVRYRSFWGVCLVHALFGLSVFAMGYGKYFMSGSLRFATSVHF